MRIVVNSVCALGSVGYTTALFPAMTLGPGTIGGSITGDNISPLHLINIKRVAFETNAIHAPQHSRNEPASLPRERARLPEPIAPKEQHTPAPAWMDAVDARLRERSSGKRASAAAARPAREPGPSEKPADPSAGTTLPPEEIDALTARYRKD
jgi:acetaldehyde dehydrogenase (acetylating)